MRIVQQALVGIVRTALMLTALGLVYLVALLTLLNVSFYNRIFALLAFVFMIISEIIRYIMDKRFNAIS